MKQDIGKKLFLNRTTVAALSRDTMKKIAGGVAADCEGSAELESEDQAFLSIVTCTAENGSHCKRCDSCCVGTKCSR